VKKSTAKKLVILDYCGTLSMGAPDFGRRKNLASALEKSGLSTFGIADVETFWRKVASPTWDEGGRTSIGYANLIARSVAVLNPDLSANNVEIREAALRFVALYMDHSPIDSAWRSLLEALYAWRDVFVVVATDHYAEATPMIRSCLERWNIETRQVKRGSSFLKGKRTSDVRAASPFFVANSADLGCLKMERCFWEALKAGLPNEHFREIAVVDDFGANEAEEDPYGESARVSERRSKMETLLGDVFESKVEMFPFILRQGETEERISQLMDFIGRIFPLKT
jgi:hypothetical protein